MYQVPVYVGLLYFIGTAVVLLIITLHRCCSPHKLKSAYKIEGIRTQAGKYLLHPLLVDITRPCFEPIFNRAPYEYGRRVSRNGTAQKAGLNT